MTAFECHPFYVLTGVVVLFNFRRSSGKERRAGPDKQRARNRGARREERRARTWGVGRVVDKELWAGQAVGEEKQARSRDQDRAGRAVSKER